MSVGEIHYFDRAAVDRIAEEQQVEVGVLAIRVNTRLGELNRTESLDIAEECSHDGVPFTSEEKWREPTRCADSLHVWGWLVQEVVISGEGTEVGLSGNSSAAKALAVTGLLDIAQCAGDATVPVRVERIETQGNAGVAA